MRTALLRYSASKGG
uniref:GSVIVT01030279001 n=1 Tax=Arundo donax TaxID=35708 RepID=A0A0A9FWI2_ARUDO